MNEKKYLLKKSTHDLLEFLKNQELLNKCKQIPLSSQSKHLLSTIIKKIIQATQCWNSEKISIRYSRISSNFPRGHDYHYCPKVIREEIENMDKIGAYSSFSIDSRNIEISIIAPFHKRYTKNYFLDCIKKIFIWLSVSSQYSNKKCSQKMNIYMYFTDLMKELPKQTGGVLTETNVNTAFTTSCKDVTELNLFREEEWFKVLIHETFHNMGLDFSEIDTTRSNQQILTLFPVDSDVRLFETYCETWAEIINILFVSYFLNDENENIDKIIKNSEKMLENERIFSLFQSVKVLYYYGMTYEELYEKSTESQMVRKNQYKEKTNVLSYYILKSLLLFYSDDFICWCLQHNGETLNFNKDPNNIDEYCKLIKEHYKRTDYIKSLGNFEEWFSNIDPEKASERFEIQTLRMSLYEIGLQQVSTL